MKPRFFNELPDDTKLEIIKYLSAYVHIDLRLVDTNMRENVRKSLIWRMEGAKDFGDFVDRVKKLSPKLRAEVLHDQMRLLTAEMMQLSPQKRLTSLLTDQQINLLKDLGFDRYRLESMIDSPCAIALFEKLMTVEEFIEVLSRSKAADKETGAVWLITQNEGIKALREKLITVHEANNMDKDSIKFLFEDDMQRLRKRHEFLMNPDCWKEAGASSKEDFEGRFHALSCSKQLFVSYKIARLNTAEALERNPENKLELLLTEDQLQHLDQSNVLDRQNLKFKLQEQDPFLSIALIENLVTIKDLENQHEKNIATRSIPGSYFLLLELNGLLALKEELITFRESISMDRCAIDALLSDDGMFALRHKLITPSEASSFDTNSGLLNLIEERVNAFKENQLKSTYELEFRSRK